MSNPVKPDCATCPSTEVCCSQKVPLSRDEWYRLRRLGAHLSPLNGSRLMNPGGEQCAFFDNGKCSIYAARPKVCRNWHCNIGGEGREQWINTEILVRELRSAGVRVITL